MSLAWVRGCRRQMCPKALKPGVHTNDFATIHGRPVRIHAAPAEDNTSNQSIRAGRP